MNLLGRWIRNGKSVPVMAISLLTLGLAACDDDGDDSPTGVDTRTLADLVEDASNGLSTLDVALDAVGLKQTLDGEGPLTVFAPSNAAFTALSTTVLSSLLEPANADLLERILTYHVVSGVGALSTDLTDGQTVTTLQGEDVTIGVSGDEVTVNGISVVDPDIEASNGIAHAIDGILTPSLDLVDVAIMNGFPTLIELVRDADLEEVLRGTPADDNVYGWTVFAPTESALGALRTVPSGDALVELLTYHVVEGVVASGDLSDGQVVTTVEGSAFTVNIEGSDVTITDESGNTVRVVGVDVPATNGLIHVIDEVIQPS